MSTTCGRPSRSHAGSDVMVETLAAGADEMPPVALDNVTAAEPFQPLIRLLSLPRYGTLDPTNLMALFLPMFFGMMLGDVAYGVVLGADCSDRLPTEQSRSRSPDSPRCS